MIENFIKPDKFSSMQEMGKTESNIPKVDRVILDRI
jgi:hypothetical protein